jgi:hypothetical protein
MSIARESAVIYQMSAAAALFLLMVSAVSAQTSPGADVFDRVKHDYAVSEGGVRSRRC